jgi:hypothetical protein
VTLQKYNQQHISLPWHKPPSVRSFILLHLQGPPSDQPFILSHLQVFHQTKVSSFPNTSRAPPDQFFIPLHFQGTPQSKVSFTNTPRVPLRPTFHPLILLESLSSVLLPPSTYRVFHRQSPNTYRVLLSPFFYLQTLPGYPSDQLFIP